MEVSHPARFRLLTTRRFWIGLSGFILLVGFFVSTGFTECSIRREEGFAGPPPEAWPMERIQEVVTFYGGVHYIHQAQPCSRMIGSVEWDFALKWQPRGYSWHYEHESDPMSDHAMLSSTFVPLWPLPLAWLIGWGAYLVRAHRLEQGQFPSD